MVISLIVGELMLDLLGSDFKTIQKTGSELSQILLLQVVSSHFPLQDSVDLEKQSKPDSSSRCYDLASQSSSHEGQIFLDPVVEPMRTRLVAVFSVHCAFGLWR